MPNPKFWQRNSRKQSESAISFGFIPGLAPPPSQSQSSSIASTPPAAYAPFNHPDLPTQLKPKRARSQRFPSKPVTPDHLQNNRRSYIQPDNQSAHHLEVPEHSTWQDDRHISADWQQGSFDTDREPVRSIQELPPRSSSQEQAIGWAIQQAQHTSQTPPVPENVPIQENTSEAPPLPMLGHQYAASKSSSDSGQPAALDRWSQRRLQRLNTEQGFREQRQGGGGSASVLSPSSSELSASYNATGSQNISDGPQQNPIQQAQPQSAPQGSSYPNPSTRTSPNSNSVASAPITDNTRSSAHQQHDPPQVHVPTQQQYSPLDAAPQYQSHGRPNTLQQSRSFTLGNGQDDSTSMTSQNNAPLPAPKAMRNNRQSMHSGVSPNTQQAQAQGGPGIAVPSVQAQQPRSGNAQQTGDVGRGTPQPLVISEEMSDEDISQLVRDHKELREKYTKVKKYYFEKEDQVKQLQNSLAHQKLAQSRTSLDDSEYSTRFNRLDGLIAQLSFSIRKNWKTIPSWLAGSVNKDAIMTGKQEMTAAGRAFISCWLVEEVFDKYFHPDLDPMLSAQLKSMQKSIRRFAPAPQTPEEEDYLTAKVVNWRLTTLEGLQEMLRSPNCPQNRSQLMDSLKMNLMEALQIHLHEPPMSDLEGGVHMIIELAVSMSTHLPLESRDVLIEYFMPGSPLSTEMMKSESGIPALGTSVAEDAAERMSMKSAGSDVMETPDGSSTQTSEHPRKRSMLSALTGTKKAHAAQGKHAGAGGSSGSLGRPESSSGKEELPPRVRMAVGIGAQVRGKTVLVKAPIFST